MAQCHYQAWTKEKLMLIIINSAVTGMRNMSKLKVLGANQCIYSVMGAFSLQRNVTCGGTSKQWIPALKEIIHQALMFTFQTLTANYKRSPADFSWFCFTKQKGTTAFLSVAWMQDRLFIDERTIKEFMLAAVKEVVKDSQVRNHVISCINLIPLSDTSTAKGVHPQSSKKGS